MHQHTGLSGIKHLYIHIPFCQRRCAYCDFNTYAHMEDRMEAYVAALCDELALQDWRFAAPHALAAPLASAQTRGLTRDALAPTIFLGGGTPSMLPLPLLERVLGAANALIPLATAEVTIEANPGTVLQPDYLRSLRAIGVNRLSMGVQSLDDPTLKVLGRIHTAHEARVSYEDARRAGFDNINLDFIFGLPGQTLAQWEATLREIVTWEVDHFSLYSLILEERTPLYAQVVGGRVSVPDDDATAEMYELAITHFAASGYAQYEISNWARGMLRKPQDALATLPPDIPPLACHHNLAYWLNADYLACGAGAHGHIFPRRYADVLAIDEYIARLSTGSTPVAETIELTHQDLAAETMFMGLRMNVGVSFAHFRARCGRPMHKVFGDTLAELQRQGLVASDEIGVRLTARGRMLGNRVFEHFV